MAASVLAAAFLRLIAAQSQTVLQVAVDDLKVALGVVIAPKLSWALDGAPGGTFQCSYSVIIANSITGNVLWSLLEQKSDQPYVDVPPSALATAAAFTPYDAAVAIDLCGSNNSSAAGSARMVTGDLAGALSAATRLEASAPSDTTVAAGALLRWDVPGLSIGDLANVQAAYLAMTALGFVKASASGNPIPMNPLAEASVAMTTASYPSLRASRALLAPGLRQWEAGTAYVTYDALSALQAQAASTASPGNSSAVIGLGVGRGYWTHFLYGSPAVAAVLTVHLNNESHSIPLTAGDAVINYKSPPTVANDLYDGETTDLRLALAAAGFDDPSFVPGGDWAQHPVAWAPQGGGAPGAAVQSSVQPPVVEGFASVADGAAGSAAGDSVDTLPGAGWAVGGAAGSAVGAWAAVYNMRENAAGFARLNASITGSQTGDGGGFVTLSVAHAERTISNGQNQTSDLFNQYVCPNPGRVCVNQTDHYLLPLTAGAAFVDLRPSYTYHGFQFVRLSASISLAGGGAQQLCTVTVGGAPTFMATFACPQDVTVTVSLEAARISVALPVTASARFGSHSVTSPAAGVLNAVWAGMVRTFRANLLSVQTSCPQREKIPWAGDTLSTMPAVMTAMSGGLTLWRAYLQDQLSAQSIAGTPVMPAPPRDTIPETVPHFQFQPGSPLGLGEHNPTSGNGSWPGDSSGWSAIFTGTAFHLHTLLGDSTLAASPQTVAALLRHLQYWTADSRGFLPTRGGGNPLRGDWCNAVVPRCGISPETNVPMSSAFFVGEHHRLAALADAAGDTALAAALRSNASSLMRSFDDLYWNATVSHGGAFGAYRAYDQTNNALPVAQNATAAHGQAAALAAARSVNASAGRLTGGFQGWAALLDVLEEAGYHGEALGTLTTAEFPSLGFMVVPPAAGVSGPPNSGIAGSGLWEHWSGIAPAPGNPSGSVSLAHPMFGSALVFLHAKAAGLRVGWRPVARGGTPRLHVDAAAWAGWEQSQPDCAAASQETRHGRVVTAWARLGGGDVEACLNGAAGPQSALGELANTPLSAHARRDQTELAARAAATVARLASSANRLVVALRAPHLAHSARIRVPVPAAWEKARLSVSMEGLDCSLEINVPNAKTQELLLGECGVVVADGPKWWSIELRAHRWRGNDVVAVLATA